MRLNYFLSIFIFSIIFYSCGDDFISSDSQDDPNEVYYHNKEGVKTFLEDAYSFLNGIGTDGIGDFEYALSASPVNWIWGSVASDDAYSGDITGRIKQIEVFNVTSQNEHIEGVWFVYYDAVSRCNEVLRIMSKTENLQESFITEVKAQVMFLRSWYYFELLKVFRNIPYITENISLPLEVRNNIDVFPLIETDLQFAVDYLPEVQSDVKRPTKYAAMALMARMKLSQSKFSEAKTYLDEIINSGRYDLVANYHDNYRISTENNIESIFEIQHDVNDGALESSNGNYPESVCFPHEGDIGITGIGCHIPSQSLVNAFKVDETGLPLLDTYNEIDLKNDDGIMSDAEFIPTEEWVDPRLDWTVGRRGIPYLDWGVMRGRDWLRLSDFEEYIGPYLNKKNMFYRSEKGIYSTTTGWADGVNANNFRALRFAHVLLWRAEVAIEENDLELARMYINRVRERAGNYLVMGRVTDYILATKEDDYEFSSHEERGTIDWNEPAANYKVGMYPIFPDQEYARKAIRHEFRLEFAMEGLRFFDLVRWGIASETMNAFFDKEKNIRIQYQSAQFIPGKNEIWPIPQVQIDFQNQNKLILTQNPGY